MAQLVRAVVLNSFKFKESSVICQTYSREHGLLPVLISGMGKAKLVSGQIYLQPLTIIEYTVNYKERKGILRAGNIALVYSPVGIVPDVRKYAISFFIAEVILKLCREKEEDKSVFELLEYIIYNFEKTDFQDLHIYFLVHYTELLGFSVLQRDEEDISQSIYADKKTQRIISGIAESTVYSALNINKADRIQIIKFILQHLELHAGLTKVRSLQVLEDVFN